MKKQQEYKILLKAKKRRSGAKALINSPLKVSKTETDKTDYKRRTITIC